MKVKFNDTKDTERPSCTYMLQQINLQTHPNIPTNRHLFILPVERKSSPYFNIYRTPMQHILLVALPAVGVAPDQGTAPSVTGLSRFIPGIIGYQPPTFPSGQALSSSAPEQRSTARHNWGRYRSPVAAILQCPPLHPPSSFPACVPVSSSVSLITPQNPFSTGQAWRKCSPVLVQFVDFYIDLQSPYGFKGSWRFLKGVTSYYKIVFGV